MGPDAATDLDHTDLGQRVAAPEAAEAIRALRHRDWRTCDDRDTEKPA